jgi:putrescine transport system permease protein
MMNHSAGLLTSRIWLAAGFVFLYLPIVTLIALSFNASPLVTSWGGFSLRWYVKLMNDTVLIEGFVLSLKIAFLTACGSVVLGTFAAVALVKYPRFRGRTLFNGICWCRCSGHWGFRSAGCSPSGSDTLCWAWPTPRW